MSAGGHAGPSAGGPAGRRARRVVVDPDGFFAVAAGFLVAAGLVAAGFAVVDRFRAVVARVAVVDAAAADADAFGAAAVRLRTAVARGLAAPAARGLAAPAVDRDAALGLRPRIAWMSAASSAISSRTSARRDVRLSRVFFVAFFRRAARQVSSERAAARAKSSHSTWRAKASAGVIAPRLTADRVLTVVAEGSAPLALPPVLLEASVISSPYRIPRSFSPMTGPAVAGKVVGHPLIRRKQNENAGPRCCRQTGGMLGPAAGSSSSAGVPSSAHRPKRSRPRHRLSARPAGWLNGRAARPTR